MQTVKPRARKVQTCAYAVEVWYVHGDGVSAHGFRLSYALRKWNERRLLRMVQR